MMFLFGKQNGRCTMVQPLCFQQTSCRCHHSLILLLHNTILLRLIRCNQLPPYTTFSTVLHEIYREMAPPGEERILKEYTGSIVLVTLEPHNVSGVNVLWDKIDPISGKGAAASRKSRAELCKSHIRCTGFIFKEDQCYTHVLTCAHVLGNLFSRDNPISEATIESLFHCRITCDHMEQIFLSERDNIANLKRDYVLANVTAICCKTDLLLLSIPNLQFVKKCKNNHRVIPIGDSPIAPLAEVVMLSWPDGKERTAVSGRISHTGRAYSAVSDDNKHGYAMRLTEVDITSDFGTSGAPLISASSGECVGVMQSGNTVFSYFTTLDDVRKTLMKWNMIEQKT